MGARNTDEFLLALRNHLRELRIQSGATQVEFARKGGNQHQSAIARIEAGTSPNVGIRILYEITRGSSVPLWEIIRKAEGEDGKNPEWGERDEWDEIEQQVKFLSPKNRKWLARIVKDVLSGLNDK